MKIVACDHITLTPSSLARYPRGNCRSMTKWEMMWQQIFGVILSTELKIAQLCEVAKLWGYIGTHKFLSAKTLPLASSAVQSNKKKNCVVA